MEEAVPGVKGSDERARGGNDRGIETAFHEALAWREVTMELDNYAGRQVVLGSPASIYGCFELLGHLKECPKAILPPPSALRHSLRHHHIPSSTIISSSSNPPIRLKWSWARLPLIIRCRRCPQRVRAPTCLRRIRLIRKPIRQNRLPGDAL